jgi:ABC-type transport system substrate-binding protein
MTVGGQMTPDTAMAEMIRQQLQAIGIDADVKEAKRGLAFTRTANAEHQTMFWTVSGSENLYLFSRHVLPVDPAECRIGMPFARWYPGMHVQKEEERRAPQAPVCNGL